MPSRDAENTGRQRRVSSEAGVSQPQQQATRQPRQAPQQEEQVITTQSGDDVWETINGMSAGSGGTGEFDKMNTSFFMRDGDPVATVVFIDENPTLFMGHNIKCTSKNGKLFFRTEQCQKSVQSYCTWCDANASNNKAVGKASKVIAFRLVDGRGKWDSQKSAMDGIPAPKIFLAPVAFTKNLKNLKDEAGGTISDKFIKLQKNTAYIPSFSTVKLASGGFDYDYIDEDAVFGEMKLPEILDVYAPLSDADVIAFIDEFASAGTQFDNNNQNQNNGGNTGGGNGFGNQQQGGNGQGTGRNVGGFGRR